MERLAPNSQAMHIRSVVCSQTALFSWRQMDVGFEPCRVTLLFPTELSFPQAKTRQKNRAVHTSQCSHATAPAGVSVPVHRVGLHLELLSEVSALSLSLS